VSAWWVVLSAVLAIFAVVGAGAVMRRLDWLTAEADASLMALTVRLLMPCLNLKVTMASEALRRPENLVWPPLLGVLTLAVGFAGAWLLALFGSRVTGLDTPVRRRTFRFVAGTFNYGYIPLPLVSLLFPRDGTLGVLMVYMVGVELAFWTLGVLVLRGGMAGAWRRLFNPPSLAVLAGVTLNLTGTARLVPSFAVDAVGLMGASAVPLALLLVGTMTADHLPEAGAAGGRGATLLAIVLRAILAPAVFVGLAFILPLSLEMKRVLVVEAAMPAAMFSIVVTRYYGGDGAMAVRLVIATSLAALAAIPLWLSAGMAWLGLG
jgi:malate permease and related proteins